MRWLVLVVALVVLIVFCKDKSRQNMRTRNALYNCIYPVYASIVLFLCRIAAFVVSDYYWIGAACFIISFLGLMVYLRHFRRQRDIPFNTLFWLVGLVIVNIMIVFSCYLLAYARNIPQR